MQYLMRILRIHTRRQPATYNFPKAPKSPNIPAPQPAPPPPTIDQAVQATRDDARVRARRGVAANVLAGPDPAAPTTGPATKLLGM